MKLFLVCSSLLIVALGHPSFVAYLAPAAAAFGYALFWKGILDSKKTRRFWLGSLWFTLVQAVYLSWMPAIEFQGIYILFVYFFLTLFLGVQFGLFCVLLPKKEEMSFLKIGALAALWTLIEWGRLFLLCGYSWNPVGISLTSYLWPMQMASLFGVLGLTFWVFFTNLLALKCIESLNRRRSYLIWGIAALIPYTFGILYLNYHRQKKADWKIESLSVAIVQTGLLPSEKIPLNGKISAFIPIDRQWISILELLKKLKTRPDLIAMPEAVVPLNSGIFIYSLNRIEKTFIQIFGQDVKTAFPELSPPYGDPVTKKVSNLFLAQTIANYFNTEIVLGLDHTETSTGRSYNSVFHLLPFKKEVCRYDKRILLPLAEYLPFKWLSPLVGAYGIKEFFTHGGQAQLFRGKLVLSPSVCYEETFSSLMRQGSTQGAEVMVNATNDGWYPYLGLAKQHFHHARIRTVENGIPLIRSCNTGISAVVNSFGETVNKLNEMDHQGKIAKGLVESTFDRYHFQTLYKKVGDLALIIPCFILQIFYWSSYGKKNSKK